MGEKNYNQEVAKEDEIMRWKAYEKLLDEYREQVNKIKIFQEKNGFSRDSTYLNKLLLLDKIRHEVHLKLIESGSKLGKNEGDILVDIVRDARTLEGYGLPEFSVLSQQDIIDTEDWNEPFIFNLEQKDEGVVKNERQSFDKDSKYYLGSDEFLLVFSLVPIVGDLNEEKPPRDYAVRVKRAGALAEEFKGKVFEQKNSEYHHGEVLVLGVVLKNDEFEKVVVTIRDNPNRFRLKEEFYSQEDRDSFIKE